VAPDRAPCLSLPPARSLSLSRAAECNWWYWGGEEGRGGAVAENQECPAWQPEEVVDVSAGSRHTFYVEADGDAYVSGFVESFYSYQGHFGVPRSQLKEGPNNFIRIATVVDEDGRPRPAPPFAKVYAGAGAPGDSRGMHALLLDRAGAVYTTGNNRKGQLCHGDAFALLVDPHEDAFRRVDLPGPAVAAAVGLDFTLLLLADGRAFGCGSNENGELGLGDRVRRAGAPTEIRGLGDVEDVVAGLNFGLFLQRDTGRAFGTGSNLFRQLCEGTAGEPATEPLVRTARRSVRRGGACVARRGSRTHRTPRRRSSR
jgi:alpha-tubulin suppressor-like RCC1 family protein